MLDEGAFADEYGAGDEGLADEPSLDGGLQSELEVAADLLEGVPGVDGAFEELAMIRVIEIEEGFGREHGTGFF
jgi:hypothetical protein